MMIMKDFPKDKTYLLSMGKAILESTKAYIKAVEANKMTNEQFFLDTLDALNSLSVKY